MGWLKKIGIQGGSVKDLWGGRGFQKNSLLGYAGYILPAYYAATGAKGAVSGYQALFAAKSGASGTATFQQAANANSRNSNIARGEAVGHDVAPDYVADPYKDTGPIEMPGNANDPQILAAAQAGQQAALVRQRRQRMVAGIAGSGSQFLLGRTGASGGGKTLLGS